MRRTARRTGLLLFFTIVCGVAAAPVPEAGLLGRRIVDFTLDDFRGRAHSLSDCADRPVVVVYFMGTECPLTKLYGPRMQGLSERFGPQGVAFLGIDSNVQDSLNELAAYARVHGITFPLLKDMGNK